MVTDSGLWPCIISGDADWNLPRGRQDKLLFEFLVSLGAPDQAESNDSCPMSVQGFTWPCLAQERHCWDFLVFPGAVQPCSDEEPWEAQVLPGLGDQCV